MTGHKDKWRRDKNKTKLGNNWTPPQVDVVEREIKVNEAWKVLMNRIASDDTKKNEVNCGVGGENSNWC